MRILATEKSTPQKQNTVFCHFEFVSPKKKNTILSATQKPREPALAFGCGTSPLRSVVGTSPVPVPCNRNQSLCCSALLFLLLLLLGDCQSFTLYMCLYQQLLFLCLTSLPSWCCKTGVYCFWVCSKHFLLLLLLFLIVC